MPYSPEKIEPKWQKAWLEACAFKTGEDFNKPKYYALDMFPYPSAAGLHVGHPLGYTATDIVSRYHRQKGYNVLHPMGWDAFGLPAEQHAIETGEHPAKLTLRNIETFRRQLQTLGLSYDWAREISTCDPEYYKWTQKIFTLLHEKGLAYQAEMAVNWCPALKTVLANDEVIDGKSERGGHPVVRKPMRQWMLKITQYAERLLQDLEPLDWPESLKEIQRNWIGKSVGAKVRFKIEGHPSKEIEVFTTRADTLFGVTYLVLAPEHPLVSEISLAPCQKKLNDYQLLASRKSDLDRTELSTEKTGEFTGASALHPFTGEKLPIYISDYVLMTYGTGAIMAVPGHDERDHEFAVKFSLPIKAVVAPQESHLEFSVQLEAYTGDGVLISSDFLNGLSTTDAKKRATERLKMESSGEEFVNYKFRDWLFSRQRYWGEPIPVLKDSHGHVVRCLNGDELPLTLPSVESYEPTGDGKSPLASQKAWIERKDKNGETLYIESDTMPGSAGSSWYFLRYTDPLNSEVMFDYNKAKYWMPVDLYVGGQEHAVGHLLYSRFWTKVLFDAGLCPVSEPFQKLVNQGMITRDGAKMSKSKGNGVSPDEVIREFGADTLRIYEMFMGPFTQTKDWQQSNLSGVHRFLSRVERLVRADDGSCLLTGDAGKPEEFRLLHKTIKKITQDIDSLSFNTAVAAMMIFVNGMYETKCKSKEILTPFLICLAPFAPHLCEELWQCGNLGKGFISLADWPKFDEKLATDDEIKIGVQINGKLRGEVLIAKDSVQEVAVAAALNCDSVKNGLDGKEIKKIVYVANRILSFVVN